MGRNSAITPEIAEAIDLLYRPGVSSRTLAAQLAEVGMGVSHATIARHLARRGAGAIPATVKDPAAAATPQGELAGFEAQLAYVDSAMAQWGPSMGSDARAVRSAINLVELKERILKSIEALKPAPNVDAERLGLLGAAAKQELLDRANAQARVDEGLRGRVQRQAETLARPEVREALARGGGNG